MSDLTILLLPTAWNERDLSRSLTSIAALMADSGVSVRCLIVEMLPAGVDLQRLAEQRIDALPDVVRQALDRQGFDYLAEQGWSARALRRAVRCSDSRYVCLLREGDEIGYRLTAEQHLAGEFDLLVGVTLDDARALARHARMSALPLGCRGLPALTGLLDAYDGALIARRELLDDALGWVGFDAPEHFLAYLNEVLAVALLRDSGRVVLTQQIAVYPDPAWSVGHREQLRGWMLPTLAERRRSWPSRFEPGTEALIDQCLRQWAALRRPGTAAAPVGVVAAALRQLAALADGADRGDPGIGAARRPVPSATPEVSLVTSAFRGQRLIHGFLDAIEAQSVFDRCELIVALPEPNLVQDLVCEARALANSSVRLLHLDADPGIYACWNLAIQQARGRYLSNANLDDRRDRDHVRRMVDALERTGADVASAAVVITHDLADVLGFGGDAAQAAHGRELWFAAEGEQPLHKRPEDFFVLDSDGRIVQCMNFPHCMPVWRRNLHERLGEFDEAAHGTYADFAFWLQAASAGARFVHHGQPLGLYYVDPNSHNRRNSDPLAWLEIVRRHLPDGMQVTPSAHVRPPDPPRLSLSAALSDAAPRASFDFGAQIGQSYGRHRSGWAYALTALRPLHSARAPVYCDTFIEKRFVWGSDPGDGGCGPAAPHLRPWIGFIHVPPYVPSWFQHEQSNAQVFAKQAWRQSLPHCLGLFTLTEHHRRYLLELLRPDFPIDVLHHPTEFPERGFDFDRYQANPRKRLLQVGWWLRKLAAVSRLPPCSLTPTLLGRSDWSKSLLSYAERRLYGLCEPGTAEVIDFVEDDAYDELLAENLVFIDFYDTSANNAVIECIARATPILVCRHPAVEEYLGADYPMYYTSYAEAASFADDPGRVRAASEHLRAAAIRDRLTLDHFRAAFAQSEVVRHAYR